MTFDEARVPGLWLARLRSFAPDRPDVDPPPGADREQARILREKMRRLADDEEWCLPPDVALIVCTTRSGLVPAHEVFAESDPVILLDEHRHAWLDLFLEDSGEERHVFASWTLREGLPGDDPFCMDPDRIRREFPIPAECSYWTVTEAFSSGPLAGSGEVELWRWDGGRAERLGVVGGWIS